MGDEGAVFAEGDFGADGAVGADGAGGGDLGAGGDDRGGVDAGLDAHSDGACWCGALAARGTTMQVMVASQTTLPSTVTMPCILTARVRQLRTVTSMRSWSPGTDGAAELGVFDAGEDHELGVAVGDLGEEQAPPVWAMASTMRTPGMMG